MPLPQRREEGLLLHAGAQRRPREADEAHSCRRLDLEVAGGVGTHCSAAPYRYSSTFAGASGPNESDWKLAVVSSPGFKVLAAA